MSDLIKEIQQWQKDLEELGSEKGKAEGRLEQVMSVLKGLGFDTLEEAKAELDRLLAVKEEAEIKAKELLATLKEKYSEHIE